MKSQPMRPAAFVWTCISESPQLRKKKELDPGKQELCGRFKNQPRTC